ELGEMADLLDIANVAGRERPDGDAGQQVPDDRRLSEANRDRAAEQGQRDGEPEVEDEPHLAGQPQGGEDVRHPPLWPPRHGWPPAASAPAFDHPARFWNSANSHLV